MIYSTKWICENLGIKNDTLRYYADRAGLLTNVVKRNPVSNYREYDDEGLEQIWKVWVLCGIGFSHKEVKSILCSRLNLYDALGSKIEALESSIKKDTEALGYAKAIKMLGQMPTVKEIGGVKFDDFMKYVKQNWNVYNDPELLKEFHLIEKVVISKEPEITEEVVEYLQEMFDNNGVYEIMYAANVNAFYHALTKLSSIDYKQDEIQSIVKLIYESFLEYLQNKGIEADMTPYLFAKGHVPTFIEGDLALKRKNDYGEDGCKFIAKAIAYFGDYNIDL